MDAGFQTRYRDGNWVPVRVTLTNNGPDFSGTLSVSAVAPTFLGQDNTLSSSAYATAITLPQGSQKRVTLSLPLYYSVSSIIVKLLDSSGNLVNSRTITLNPLSPGSTLVGVLSDSTSGFGPLNAAALPGQAGSVAIQFLDAGTLPATVAVLKNFDVIVLDNFTAGTLSAAQLGALQGWVQEGGALVLVGGPEWRRTLGGLPTALVPVTIQGTTTIAAKTILLPAGAPGTEHAGQSQESVQAPVTVSAGTVQGARSTVILASHSVPLLVQSQQGLGRVIYLAYDPALEPLLSWPGERSLWQGLLLRGLGDHLLTRSSSVGSFNVSEQPLLSYRLSTFLQLLLPNALPSPWWALAVVFVAFLLVIGPLRYLLVVWLKRRAWSWRIVLSSIVIFSLLSYGLAYRQKGASILSDSITLVQLGQSSSSASSTSLATPASITTYLGVFVPNQGNFQVHVSGGGLAQPSPDDLVALESGASGPTETSPAAIMSGQSGNDVNLQNAGIWTLHALLSQQNRQLPGGLTSKLLLQNGLLVGTITNNLGYALNDVLLLTSNDALKIGHMAAGETKHVKLKPSSVPLAANATLADLVSLRTNSPFYDQLPASKLTTPWLRHLAMLFALDDEGLFGSPTSSVDQCKLPVPILPTTLCFGPAQISNNVAGSTNILATPGWPRTTTRDSDPLLAPDATTGPSATLIGWAESPSGTEVDFSVNNSSPTDLNETLIQAPLPVSLSASLNLPPSIIPGRLVDVTGKSAQEVLPGIYTIATGSMTFEYIVPTSGLKLTGLAITERSDANIYAQAAASIDPSALPFSLYNWRTHAWDSISLFEYSYTTKDIASYLGPGGRVLVQLANSDSSLGTFAFGTPSLNLTGQSLVSKGPAS